MITSSLENIGLLDKLRFLKKPTKSSRKLTPLVTSQTIRDYWHKKSAPSTITLRPEKLKLTDKPRIQTSLDFVDTVRIIEQRNVSFYENIWSVTNETVKVLYHKFLNENLGIKISCGTFLALKSFYVRPATTKDLEMCCCKKHLHARWVIKAMIENCEKQMINLGYINDYYTFFKQVTQHCKKEEHTNIIWDCTPDKKSCCNHILTEWYNLK